jgi:hypothetical protein
MRRLSRVISFHKSARRDVFNYIEMFYNSKRRHVYANSVSPVEFETSISTGFMQGATSRTIQVTLSAFKRPSSRKTTLLDSRWHVLLGAHQLLRLGARIQAVKGRAREASTFLRSPGSAQAVREVGDISRELSFTLA